MFRKVGMFLIRGFSLLNSLNDKIRKENWINLNQECEKSFLCFMAASKASSVESSVWLSKDWMPHVSPCLNVWYLSKWLQLTWHWSQQPRLVSAMPYSDHMILEQADQWEDSIESADPVSTNQSSARPDTHQSIWSLVSEQTHLNVICVNLKQGELFYDATSPPNVGLVPALENMYFRECSGKNIWQRCWRKIVESNRNIFMSARLIHVREIRNRVRVCLFSDGNFVQNISWNR